MLAAARAAKRGASLEEVTAAAEGVARRVILFATLKTLEHVHRGGRLGEAAALLGSQLRIVPILDLGAGRVRVAAVTRSWQNALERLVELAAERVSGSCGIASAFHGDLLGDAQELRDRFLERVSCREFMITEFTPVMGAHTGPDVVGLAFYCDG